MREGATGHQWKKRMFLVVAFVSLLSGAWYRHVKKYFIKSERRGRFDNPQGTVIDCLACLFVGLGGIVLGYELRANEQQREIAEILNSTERGSGAKGAVDAAAYVFVIGMCLILLRYALTSKDVTTEDEDLQSEKIA